jgi:hypothetical protein
VIRWFIQEQDKRAQAQTKQKPEWQKPDQGEDPAPPAPPMKAAAAPKKAVKKSVAKKAIKTAPVDPSQTGQETSPAV